MNLWKRSGLILMGLIMTSSVMAETHIIKMFSDSGKGIFQFQPAKITIESGDTVMWVNVVNVPHNAVSDAVPPKGKQFKSPHLMRKGHTWHREFITPGTYKYSSKLEDEGIEMKGVIIVDAPTPDKELKYRRSADEDVEQESANSEESRR